MTVGCTSSVQHNQHLTPCVKCRQRFLKKYNVHTNASILIKCKVLPAGCLECKHAKISKRRAAAALLSMSLWASVSGKLEMNLNGGNPPSAEIKA